MEIWDCYLACRMCLDNDMDARGGRIMSDFINTDKIEKVTAVEGIDDVRCEHCNVVTRTVSEMFSTNDGRYLLAGVRKEYFPIEWYERQYAISTFVNENQIRAWNERLWELIEDEDELAMHEAAEYLSNKEDK